MKGFKGTVGIMGGEPTLHPEFEKFVSYYRENIGYDDFTTACYKPTSNFVNHILANAYNINYCNQRGLWTSVGPKYYEHFELIQDTFGYQLVNDHSNPSMHETLMATRNELGIPDDKWLKLRDNCWIQNLWSASITPKGAFYCEVAAAMDATLGGPGGWKIEQGWWKRTPADFADQLHWCEICSAALPMPKRDAREEVDDVSPIWRQKLIQIDSPKLKRGLINEFAPRSYNPGEHKVICEVTPYMRDQSQRIGSAQKILQPQEIVAVLWLTERIGDDEAKQTVERLNAVGLLNFVVSAKTTHRHLADAVYVPFIDAAKRIGNDIFKEIKEQSKARDWILLMRDIVPSNEIIQLLGNCVFNPGCVYWQPSGIAGPRTDTANFQFFNVRGSSLQHGGDLFNIVASYPKRKVVMLCSNQTSNYNLTPIQMFYRRAIKRVHWIRKRIGRKLGFVP